MSCPCAVCGCSFAGLPFGPPPHNMLCSSLELLQFTELGSIWTNFMCLFCLVVASHSYPFFSMNFWLLSFLSCLLRWLLTWNLLRTCMNCTRKSLQMSSSWAGKLGYRGIGKSQRLPRPFAPRLDVVLCLQETEH